MNNLKHFLTTLSLACGLIFINSCVKDDEFALPPTEGCTGMVTNTTLGELYDMVNASTAQNNIVEFTEDKIIEGYVITSDETGNFFKTISIQDSPENPTKGVQIEIDAYNLYTKYPKNSKVQVNLKGLHAGMDRGVLKVGSPYTSGTGNNAETRVGRMTEALAENNVKKTCEAATPIVPREFNSLNEALKPENINTLVTIHNVQFQSPETDLTYGDTSSAQATLNRVLVDKVGRTVDLRNSGYASWRANPLPTQSGSITVLVSIFRNSYQVFISDPETDVNFDQPRFDSNGGGNNNTEAKDLLFKGSDFENWSDFLAQLNSYGLSNGLAVQGQGTGRDGSNSFYLNGQTGSTNPYVFTAKAGSVTVPANPTRITLWVKGSAAKSLSFNVYTTAGTIYYNLGELSTSNNVTLQTSSNNQYTGAVNTNGQWVMVTLNISGNSLNTSGDLFALKAGSGTKYDIHIDNIKVE